MPVCRSRMTGSPSLAMDAKAAALAVALLLCCHCAAFATTFNDFYVGLDAPGTLGWSCCNTPTFYQDWADSVAPLYTDTDILVFDYFFGYHDVVLLDFTAYITCDTSNPIYTYITGNDRVLISEPGVYYFSSSFEGDCGSDNMRFSIEYVAGSRPTGDTPSPPARPPPSSRPPTPTSLSPPNARNPPLEGSTLPPGLLTPPGKRVPSKSAASSGARVACLLLQLAALGLSFLLLT